MKTIFAFTLLLLVLSCSKSDTDDPVNPLPADRDKFIGTWAGNYSCPGGGAIPDTMVIRPGSGAVDVSIIIHVEVINPDTVSGELTEPNLIMVPEQSMGGAPGTAVVTFQEGLLIYSQSGLGFTCGGTDYTLVP